MVFLIGGETHTGKTFLAQKLLEMHHFPYMSLDHLKMGFIRGMNPPPFDVAEDTKIAEFLFGIVAGIVNVCLENNQNLMIEGVYLHPLKRKFFLIILILRFFICFLVRNIFYKITHLFLKKKMW